jgi:hypothetical protein
MLTIYISIPTLLYSIRVRNGIVQTYLQQVLRQRKSFIGICLAPVHDKAGYDENYSHDCGEKA